MFFSGNNGNSGNILIKALKLQQSFVTTFCVFCYHCYHFSFWQSNLTRSFLRLCFDEPTRYCNFPLYLYMEEQIYAKRSPNLRCLAMIFIFQLLVYFLNTKSLRKIPLNSPKEGQFLFFFIFFLKEIKND